MNRACLLSGWMFVLYALLSSGTTGSGDANVRYQVARTLVARGDLALPSPVADRSAVGRNGRRFALYGVGQSLVFALPEAGVQGLCTLLGGQCHDDVWQDVSRGAASTVVLPLISAIGLGFLYLMLTELGFRSTVAAVTTVLIGVGSLLTPYAKFHQEENQIAALIFAAMYFAVRFGNDGRAGHGILAAVLCWAPLWFRVSAIAVSAPAAVFLLVCRRPSAATTGRRAAAVALVTAALVTAGWLLFYNWYRFGSVTETGYLTAWTARGDFNSVSLILSRGAAGLVGPLAHPSKSLLVYSPLILVSLAAAPYAFQHRPGRLLLFTSGAMLGLSIVVSAPLRHWGGDHAWGPRYQVAGHALFLALSAYAWQRWPSLSRPARTLAGVAVAAAIGVQMIAVAFNYNLEYQRGLRRPADPPASGWDVIAKAQIPLRLDSVYRFRSMWAMSPPAPANATQEYSIPAFLPWKLGQRFGATVWRTTLTCWLLGLAVWVVCGWRLLRPNGVLMR